MLLQLDTVTETIWAFIPGSWSFASSHDNVFYEMMNISIDLFWISFLIAGKFQSTMDSPILI